MEHDFLGQYLPETSRSNGISEYSHNFKFRTECSKRKFVFHFLKAIYDTWVSGLRAVFWYRPELICINGKRDSRKKKIIGPEFLVCLPFSQAVNQQVLLRQ